MAEKSRDEKSEKRFNEKNEKELQKHDEKVEQRDALSSVIWAVILVWAGLVFFAANSGWLEQLLNGDILTRYLPPGMSFSSPACGALSCSARALFCWEKPPSAWQCPITGAALAARSSLPRF